MFFYAVAKGKTIGIFNTWKECQNSINGFSGAKFKKFSLSLAYDQIGNFENEWNATGTNGNNTIGNYFLNYAQGLRLDEISNCHIIYNFF